MKCAKCGAEISPNDPQCPGCAAAERNDAPDGHDNTPLCPNCGSDRVDKVRRVYNSCCGCLGLLLFSWWGLLLGLVGAGDADYVCRQCGFRWPATGNRAGIGCVVIIAFLLGTIIAVSVA